MSMPYGTGVFSVMCAKVWSSRASATRARKPVPENIFFDSVGVFVGVL